MINVEIIKGHAGQILPCGQVTGNKELTIGGLSYIYTVAGSEKVSKLNHFVSGVKQGIDWNNFKPGKYPLQTDSCTPGFLKLLLSMKLACMYVYLSP